MVTFWLTLNALLFAAVTGYAVFLFYQAVFRRFLYLRLGRPIDFRARREGAQGEFWSQVFGQKKLLKDRKSGLMHLVVFYGFIVLQFGAIDLIVKDYRAEAIYRCPLMRCSGGFRNLPRWPFCSPWATLLTAVISRSFRD